jgi:hypothetical protein
LIDAQVYQGSSGSPVFSVATPIGGVPVKFLGVLSAGMLKHAKLTKIPVNLDRFGIEHMIGLGVVQKPTLVRELVDLAARQVRATLDKPANSESGEAAVPEAAPSPPVGTRCCGRAARPSSSGRTDLSAVHRATASCSSAWARSASTPWPDPGSACSGIAASAPAGCPRQGDGETDDRPW